MLMADSRHSLWDAAGERHALFRRAEGRREGMFLLPAAINLLYALQQGYDFIHFQVRPPLPCQSDDRTCWETQRTCAHTGGDDLILPAY